jgi:Chromate resistance exported protein
MKWVTRERPKTDRIACPWLIKRFIDPAAEIVYVARDHVLDVAQSSGGNSFDAPGATRCTPGAGFRSVRGERPPLPRPGPDLHLRPSAGSTGV